MTKTTGNRSKRAARDFLKCHRCRSDGKKCLDADNGTQAQLSSPKQWKTCKRCAQLGHPCGPRERANNRRQSTQRITPQQRSEISDDDEHVQSEEVLQSAHESLTKLFSPLDKHVICQDLQTKFAHSLILQQILFRIRCEQSCIAHRLPDNKLLELWTSQLKSMYAKLEEQFRSMLKDWHTHHATHEYCHPPDTSLKSQNLLLKLELGQWRHMSLESGWPGLAEWGHSVHIGAEGTYSLWHDPDSDLAVCTQHIMEGIHPVTHKLLKYPPVSVDVSEDTYIRAAGQLREILGPVFLATPVDNESAVGASKPTTLLPAAHIAYYNSDKEKAFRLSSQNGKLELIKNAFGLNLLHLITLAGDCSSFHRLKDSDSDAIASESIAKINFFSPLELAVILDDSTMFNAMIEGHLYNCHWTRGLLELAIASKSATIVSIILERKNLAMPPYTPYALRAIQVGSEEILLLIIPFLLDYGTSLSEMDSIATQAEAAGMMNGIQKLQQNYPTMNPYTLAAADLQQHQIALANGTLFFDPPSLMSSQNSSSDTIYTAYDAVVFEDHGPAFDHERIYGVLDINARYGY